MGGLRAEHGETVITRFRTQKFGSLLAYLAFHRLQVHSREFLIAMLWPDAEEKAGRANLSVALSSLRHQLEPPGTPAGAVLRADRFSVGVNPAAVTTDVAEFEVAIRAAANTGSVTEQAQHLARALDLYRGRLLPGQYEEWITAEQERLAGLFFDAAGRLIGHLEAAGDPGGALSRARQAVAADPLREEGHGHLIRLLAATGQPGAALRQYRELERLLDEELGEEPSAPLRALARQIEKQSGLAASPAVTVRTPVARQAPAASGGSPGQPATVNFLLTDIAESTRLWERTGDAFRQALDSHHRLLRETFARHGGQEIKEAGDSFLVAFAGAKQALACAVAGQQALAG